MVLFHLKFVIVNFPFLDGDIPRAASDGVYISQLISIYISYSPAESELDLDLQYIQTF